jgi:hypothetical protein
MERFCGARKAKASCDFQKHLELAKGDIAH